MATQFPVSEDVPLMGCMFIQYYNFCALLNLGNQVLKVLVSLTFSPIPTTTIHTLPNPFYKQLVCVNCMYQFITDQYLNLF